ncbi:hypothetical protein F2P79_014638 [Pimephales promelas]|nr:hypothetical protein F2P79_014638 [Pimephales promelas]
MLQLRLYQQQVCPVGLEQKREREKERERDERPAALKDTDTHDNGRETFTAHSHNAYLLVLCYAIRNRLPLKLLNAPVGLDSLLDKRVGAYGWVAESSGYGDL